MPTKPQAHKPFVPNSGPHPLHPKLTNVVIGGDLGYRAAVAAAKCGMTHRKFIAACIEYALANMEAPNA
jgi:hypothetical protein